MVPHAPLLLPEVAGPKSTPATAGLAAAVATLDLGGLDLVVIASPHGRSTGVYSRCAGDLDAFGPRGIEASAETDPDIVMSLAEAWGRPVLEEDADHGVVVPLSLLPLAATPVVAVAFAEGSGVDEAGRFAAALTEVAPQRRVAFVASANLSAGLGERAPIPSLEGAVETDAAVLRSLSEDPAALGGLATALAAAGSCAAAPLAAFGTLFGGSRCDVLAYEHPFGVGYPVAVTR